MISGLLELSALLDEDQLIDVRTRSRCLVLLEHVAHAQERALVEPLSGAGHVEPACAERAKTWAAGTAAATRRLKQEILEPDTATMAFLRQRTEKMISIACSERWKDLPEEPSPSGRKRARAWLSITARTLVIAALPAAALILYQLVLVAFAFALPHAPTWLPAVAYAIWPVITILWRLDPDFAAKADLFRRPGSGTGAGAPGDRAQPPRLRS